MGNYSRKYSSAFDLKLAVTNYSILKNFNFQDAFLFPLLHYTLIFSHKKEPESVPKYVPDSLLFVYFFFLTNTNTYLVKEISAGLKKKVRNLKT